MRGEVVVVPFPFSDLSTLKSGPAIVLIDLPGPDVVLAAISTTGHAPHAVPLGAGDFQRGRFDHPSFVNPTKLSTFQRSQVRWIVGTVTENQRAEITAKLVSLLS